MLIEMQEVVSLFGIVALGMGFARIDPYPSDCNMERLAVLYILKADGFNR